MPWGSLVLRETGGPAAGRSTHRRPGWAQGRRLLAALRRWRPAIRACGRGGGYPPSPAGRRPLPTHLPGRGRLPDLHPGRVNGSSAVATRALAGIRHTNLLERTFGETRRRTKVIGRLLVSGRALRWCGRCWAAPARLARFDRTRLARGRSKISAANCSNHPSGR
jgi:hypothetical protein